MERGRGAEGEKEERIEEEIEEEQGREKGRSDGGRNYTRVQCCPSRRDSLYSATWNYWALQASTGS